MEKDHQVSRIVTNNLTAFCSIVLGMLLVLALTACGNFRLPVQPTQAALPSQAASPEARKVRSRRRPLARPRAMSRAPLPAGPPSRPPRRSRHWTSLPEELSGQKITFWHPWQGELGEVLQAIIDEYNRTNRWGVEVEVRTFDSFGSLEQAFDTALVTGDRPSLLTAYDDRAQHWNQNGQALVNLQAYTG